MTKCLFVLCSDAAGEPKRPVHGVFRFPTREKNAKSDALRCIALHDGLFMRFCSAAVSGLQDGETVYKAAKEFFTDVRSGYAFLYGISTLRTGGLKGDAIQ